MLATASKLSGAKRSPISTAAISRSSTGGSTAASFSRATAIISAFQSIATTRAPRRASATVRLPVPQPSSSTRRSLRFSSAAVATRAYSSPAPPSDSMRMPRS